ncbi:MAG: hypothetical protein R3F61_24045 [Myxococcota bacterium]
MIMFFALLACQQRLGLPPVLESYTIEQTWSDGTEIELENPSGYDSRGDAIVWDSEFAFILELESSGCESSVGLHRITGNDTFALPIDGRSVLVGEVSGTDRAFGLDNAYGEAARLDDTHWQFAFEGDWCTDAGCTTEAGSLTVVVDTSRVDMSGFDRPVTGGSQGLCEMPEFADP